MQSRSFGAIARRSISYFNSNTNDGSLLWLCLGTSTPYRTADPASHATDKQAHQPAVPHGMPQETKQKYEPETGKADFPQCSDDYDQQHNNKPPIKATEPFSPPKPLHSSSPRLESTGVQNPADPTVQQKRSNPHVASSQPRSTAVTDVSCTAGVDATAENVTVEQQEEDDMQYYKSHKASPLAEIEIADTRKPITQATDGYYGGGGGDEVGWRPEQLDTAEQALQRATDIWRLNAERGDPDSPHGRVLRALRGEYF